MHKGFSRVSIRKLHVSQPFLAGLSDELQTFVGVKRRSRACSAALTEGPTRHSEELNNSADLVLQEDQCKQWLLLAWKRVFPRLLIIHSVVPQVGAWHGVEENPGCLHSFHVQAPLLLTSLRRCSLLKPPWGQVSGEVNSFVKHSDAPWLQRCGWTRADSCSVWFTPADTGSHRRLFWCRDIWF